MWQNGGYRNIKWTSAALLQWYCYAIKTNSTTIRSRLSQPASVGRGDMSNCKLITAWRCNCEPGSCAVRVSYRQKNFQESNQLIRLKMPTSGFYRNIWFLIPISMWGKCSFFSPCERPCDHWLFYIRFHKQG